MLKILRTLLNPFGIVILSREESIAVLRSMNPARLMLDDAETIIM